MGDVFLKCNEEQPLFDGANGKAQSWNRKSEPCGV